MLREASGPEPFKPSTRLRYRAICTCTSNAPSVRLLDISDERHANGALP